MDRLHPPFPIDLVLADRLFPFMETAAKNLEHIPQFYADIDFFFGQRFLELFTNSGVTLPSHDAKWQQIFSAGV